MVSVYPCDVHGMRIRGALEGIRITLLFPDYRTSRKLRVCPTDLDAMLESHVSDWLYVSDEGLQASTSLCLACEQEASPGSRLVPAFVYVWRRGQPVMEYFSEYCPACATGIERQYALVREYDLYHAAGQPAAKDRPNPG